VELLHRLRDDLKQASGNRQQLCGTLTQFIEKHCAADAELRDSSHILAKACSDALTQSPGD
jgi:hypothetical protein